MYAIRSYYVNVIDIDPFLVETGSQGEGPGYIPAHAGTGLEQAEDPAVFVVVRDEADLLHPQLPLQQATVGHPQLVAYALGQEAGQALVNDLLLRRRVAVPVDHLVGEALSYNFV